MSKIKVIMARSIFIFHLSGLTSYGVLELKL